MASRRKERETSEFGRKLIAWTIVIAITVWASRNPHQAAAVVHAIATAITSAAHHAKSSH